MPAKEALTQVETDKLEIDPDFDFRAIAQRPFADLTPNEISMFKWSGIYHQLQPGFFMIRLRLPGGVMTAYQLERAAELAEEFGQDQLCITTRQTLQFHWIRQQDLFRILEGMQEVGISTRNACGDVTRNVVACPLVDVCPHELGDTFAVVSLLADDPKLLNEYRNLPRKHKISVAGCDRACGQTLMNCEGWHPVRRMTNGREETGWRFHAGGGLGARPILAKRIFDWVPAHLLRSVTRACTEAFNRHGDRRRRTHARLKVVVDRLGAEGFAQLLLGILKEWQITTEGIEIARSQPEIRESFLDNQTVIPQRQAGHNTVRAIIPRGEFSSSQARAIADWATRFGDGTIVFTNRQNLQFRSVPDSLVEPLLDKIRTMPWLLDGHERLPDVVACVGTTVCNLAVADTPNTYHAICRELASDKALWEAVGPLRINMNGCPNSCAQHAISDIGLRGTRKREETGSEEGFSVYVGGSLAGSGHIAEFVCDVAGPDVVPLLRQLLQLYLQDRSAASETFGAWARRLTGDEVRQRLLRVMPAGRPLNLLNLDLRPVFDAAVDTPHKRQYIGF